jgi:hypothetical protein
MSDPSVPKAIDLPEHLHFSQTMAATCTRCGEVLVVPPNLSARYYVEKLMVFGKIHSNCPPKMSVYTDTTPSRIRASRSVDPFSDPL